MIITLQNLNHPSNTENFAIEPHTMLSNVGGSCLANDQRFCKKTTLVHTDDALDDNEG